MSALHWIRNLRTPGKSTPVRAVEIMGIAEFVGCGDAKEPHRWRNQPDLPLATLREKCYLFAMHDKLNITVEPAEPEFIQRAARYRANGEWLTEHGAPWFAQFPGKYIAVSEGEVFVADDALEARRLASEKHPGDEPFVQYIPRDNRPRIYAC